MTCIETFKQTVSETAVSRVYKKEVKDASKVVSEEGTVRKIEKQTRKTRKTRKAGRL